jgi:hypothetical protein
MLVTGILFHGITYQTRLKKHVLEGHRGRNLTTGWKKERNSQFLQREKTTNILFLVQWTYLSVVLNISVLCCTMINTVSAQGTTWLRITTALNTHYTFQYEYAKLLLKQCIYVLHEEVEGKFFPIHAMKIGSVEGSLHPFLNLEVTMQP